MKKSLKTSQRLVLKVGSSVLTGGKTAIVPKNLGRIVRHISSFVQRGSDVILVSSGAIACGLSLMGFKKRPTNLAQLQATAALGQNVLMQEYSKGFKKFNLQCGQILLTREDFSDRMRYLNIKHTIDALLKLGIIPIINENDAISTEEIKIGDNDTLSAYVAVAVKADGLLILTDIDGFYKKFDKKDCTGELIKKVDVITHDIESCGGGTDKISCVGGMSTKVKAAKIATKAGIPVILANGLRDELKIDFTSDKTDGTLFTAGKK